MSAEMLTLEDYNRMVAEGSVDTVICATPDMHGRLVGKRLTTQAFQSLGIAGTGIHASTYLFASDLEMNPLNLTISNDQNGYLDFRMVPDLTTMRRVPWEPASVLVLCDALQEDSDDPITVAPRQVLRQQIQRATERGLMLKFASELEFFLAALPPEEAAQAKYRDLPMTSQYRADYQILQSGRDDWFIRQLRNQLPEFGIPIESSKTEWGLGQQELTLDYCEALRMADMHVLFKHAVKDLARKNGLTASFMPKLHIDEVGSSCHLHVSLWSAETGEPLDWGNPGMSPVFASFVAGQLEHAIDLGLMFAPTVNSYKRFVPDQFAGTSIVVGNDNRSCAFRLVGHGHSFRLENRIPGADANPYFAYAATIAAGLSGIDTQSPPPAIYEGNAYADASLPLMPSSLSESLRRFESSQLARESLGEEVYTHLRDFYRAELTAFESSTVTDWEINRYFERA